MTRYRFAWSIPPWERVPTTTADLIVSVCRAVRAAREKGMDPIWTHAMVMRAFKGKLPDAAKATMWELVKNLSSGPGYTDQQIRDVLEEIER